MKLNDIIDVGANHDNNDCDSELLKIDLSDVQEVIAFWNSSIVCYVIGANMPIQVMEGFIRRIWKFFRVIRW